MADKGKTTAYSTGPSTGILQTNKMMAMAIMAASTIKNSRKTTAIRRWLVYSETSTASTRLKPGWPCASRISRMPTALEP